MIFYNLFIVGLVVFIYLCLMRSAQRGAEDYQEMKRLIREIHEILLRNEK